MAEDSISASRGDLQRPIAIGDQSPPAAFHESHWRNTLLYTAAFGLLGGLIGALAGEAVMQIVLPARFAAFEAFALQLQPLAHDYEQGNLSEAEYQSRVFAIAQPYADNPYLIASVDPALSEPERTAHLAQLAEEDEIGQLQATFGMLVASGVAIAVALAIAEPAVSGNMPAVIARGSLAVTQGTLGAAVSLVVGLTLYELLGGGQEIGVISFRQLMARGLAWSAFGAFLAVAPGVVLKSRKRIVIGVIGGALGGLAGGLLFDPVTVATGSLALSRMTGIVAIGLLSGVGVGLIEQAAKTGWLRVVAGPLVGQQFILYQNSTTIGSSPQCDVFLPKDPHVRPLHAAIHAVAGGYEIEDCGGGTFVDGRPVRRARLRHRAHVQLGATVLLFQEIERSRT